MICFSKIAAVSSYVSNRTRSYFVRALSQGSKCSSDFIHLKGLIFFARHGVYLEERKLGQKFSVDVTIRTDLSKVRDDDLDTTINYAQVYEVVRNLMTKGQPKRLIETLAENIAKDVLERYARAEEIRVGIYKPQVAVEGVVGGFGVEITRKQSNFDSHDNEKNPANR